LQQTEREMTKKTRRKIDATLKAKIALEEAFGVSDSTIHAKARFIERAVRVNALDPRWMAASNQPPLDDGRGQCFSSPSISRQS